jgi:hypothetical protein
MPLSEQTEPTFSATDTNFSLFGDTPSSVAPHSLFHDEFAPEFGSRAATSEYAVLSSMLNGSSSAAPNDAPSYDFLSDTRGGSPFLSATSNPSATLTSAAPSSFDYVSSLQALLQGGSSDSNRATTSIAPFAQSQSGGTSQTNGMTLDGAGHYRSASGAMRAEDVYRHIDKPYPYAQQYHVLIKHLKERFDKNDILRVVRALAVFRPSLIALQMPLTEEDEVFAEKCFQRTLIVRGLAFAFAMSV